jgi:hypothetical protein
MTKKKSIQVKPPEVGGSLTATEAQAKEALAFYEKYGEKLPSMEKQFAALEKKLEQLQKAGAKAAKGFIEVSPLQAGLRVTSGTASVTSSAAWTASTPSTASTPGLTVSPLSGAAGTTTVTVGMNSTYTGIWTGTTKFALADGTNSALRLGVNTNPPA